jgi:ribosome-binding factor A
VRIVPHIAFHADTTAEDAEKMDKIIDKLNIPPNPEEGSE